MSDPTRVDTTRLQRLAHSSRDAAALMAAVGLGLFTRVARGEDTEAALARALGLTPTNAERLVAACVALGPLVRDGARVLNAPDVARFPVEGEPGYAGPWILFSKPDGDPWGRLTAHRRRDDATILGKHAGAEFTVEAARRYHEATYAVGLGAGRRSVRRVDLSRRRRILDLGGGSGCSCIAAAQRHPHLTAVVFGLPPVVEVAREFIARHGLSDRIACQAGDFTRDPFPPGADVVIMASNLPQYSREVVPRVWARAFAALRPGGEMHLIGEMLDADRRGPVEPALWGLAEALRGVGRPRPLGGRVRRRLRPRGVHRHQGPRVRAGRAHAAHRRQARLARRRAPAPRRNPTCVPRRQCSSSPADRWRSTRSRSPRPAPTRC